MTSHMKYTKEIKVGLTAIVAIAALYLGLKYIKGTEVFSSENQYYIYYNSVDALENSSPVMINGFMVGRVTGLEFIPSSQPRIQVEISVSKDILLPKGTSAELRSSSILGGKLISLHLPKEGPPLSDGDTLTARVRATLTGLLGRQSVQNEVSDFISNITALAKNLSTSGAVLDKTLQRLDTLAFLFTLMVEHNQLYVNHSVKQLSIASSQLNNIMKQADSLLVDSRHIIKTLREEDVAPFVQDARSTLRQLDSLSASLNAGRGTLGKLFVEDSLYYSIQSALHSIQTLADHFNKRPKDFLSPLGRSEKDISRRALKEVLKGKSP